MLERVKGLGRDIATARAFLYTFRHSSPFVEPTKDYWDHLSREGMSSLLENLSNPDDEERRHIKRILGEIGVESVLDAGCGPATEYESYRTNGLGNIRYVGTDLSKRMLATARQRFNGISLVRSDIGALPFKDRSFDAVVLRHVLEHQPEGYKKVVEEAVRVARKAVVVDFFLPPLGVGFDIRLANNGGVSTNWYSKSRFEKFILGLPTVAFFDLVRCPNKFGQSAAIYTLLK